MQGTDLGSVDSSEISVTVGGEKCEERASRDDDPNTVSCCLLWYCCHSHSLCMENILSELPLSLSQYVCDVPADPPNGVNEAEVVVRCCSDVFHVLVIPGLAGM